MKTLEDSRREPHDETECIGPGCEVCRRWLIEQQLAVQEAFFNPKMWFEIGFEMGQNMAAKREQLVMDIFCGKR